MSIASQAAPRPAGPAPDALPITVAYQPFVELRTGRLVGMEALARFWTRSKPHVVREAELSGHSETIDLAVLRQVVADMRTDVERQLPVHVNVSSASLSGPAYLWAARALLEAEPDAATRLVFEVTETAPLPSATAVRRFAAGIRSAGARIAVDDVPAGFDRMHAIGLLAPEVIKLDGSTLRRSLHDGSDRVRLEAASILARDHDAVVIAEGIEDQAHIEAALRCGAEIGQGYLLGMPRCCPQADVEAYQSS